MTFYPMKEHAVNLASADFLNLNQIALKNSACVLSLEGTE